MSHAYPTLDRDGLLSVVDSLGNQSMRRVRPTSISNRRHEEYEILESAVLLTVETEFAPCQSLFKELTLRPPNLQEEDHQDGKNFDISTSTLAVRTGEIVSKLVDTQRNIAVFRTPRSDLLSKGLPNSYSERTGLSDKFSDESASNPAVRTEELVSKIRNNQKKFGGIRVDLLFEGLSNSYSGGTELPRRRNLSNKPRKIDNCVRCL